MNFDDIRKYVQEDMQIDDTQLDLESLRIPQLHNKYLNLFHDERLKLKRMKYEYASSYKAKWEYYSGKMSEEELQSREWEPFDLKILKQDLDKYLDGDADLILEKQKITYQEEKVSYLESVLKSINNRNWEIKNAIEWRKFLNGT